MKTRRFAKLLTFVLLTMMTLAALFQKHDIRHTFEHKFGQGLA